MRRVIGLCLLAWMGWAAAQDQSQGQGRTFSVLPSAPLADQPFQIRIAYQQASCTPLPPGIAMQRVSEQVILFRIEAFDFCVMPLPEQSRTYPVAPLPAGQYTFQFALCGNPPPPIDRCLVVEEQTVWVLGTPQPRSIPMVSTAARVVSILGVLLLAWLAVWRRRRVVP